MFLNIHIILPIIEQVIILPRNAINYTLSGQSVFILVPTLENNKPIIAKYSNFKNGKIEMISTGKVQYIARQISVTTSMTKNNSVIVNGIEAGNIIATSGQNKLQNNSVVIINNEYNFKKNST